MNRNIAVAKKNSVPVHSRIPSSLANQRKVSSGKKINRKPNVLMSVMAMASLRQLLINVVIIQVLEFVI
jgi:hypothetical protein